MAYTDDSVVQPAGKNKCYLGNNLQLTISILAPCPRTM